MIRVYTDARKLRENWYQFEYEAKLYKDENREKTFPAKNEETTGNFINNFIKHLSLRKHLFTLKSRILKTWK